MTVSLNSNAPVIPPEFLLEANIAFVRNFVGELLHNAFPHLMEIEIKVTVEGLFSLNQDVSGLYDHLKDFLVQIKVCYFYLLVCWFLKLYFKYFL